MRDVRTLTLSIVLPLLGCLQNIRFPGDCLYDHSKNTNATVSLIESAATKMTVGLGVGSDQMAL
jgi:hypothetical protein